VREINDNIARKFPAKALLSSFDYFKLGRVSLRKIDLAALVIFPIVFLVFNVAYWTHYSILLQGSF
jgi:hypothetical protein